MKQTYDGAIYSLAICDSQPLMIEGIRSVLQKYRKFQITVEATNIDNLRFGLQKSAANIVLIDKVFCTEVFSQWLQESSSSIGMIVWGTAIAEAEALRMLQSGIRGILRKSATPETLIMCLSAVAQGQSWMEEFVLRAATFSDRPPHSRLTAREQQVITLVENGMRNRDIAKQLGIQPGTVKIHLKHIFEKTGVRGRYGLALTGLKRRGLLSIERAIEERAIESSNFESLIS